MCKNYPTHFVHSFTKAQVNSLFRLDLHKGVGVLCANSWVPGLCGSSFTPKLRPRARLVV